MLTKNSNLIEIVKPFSKDRITQEKILNVLNMLRPEEEDVYRTYPAVLAAEQKVKDALEKAGIVLGDDEICVLCNMLDEVYIKGIAHGISLMIDEEPENLSANLVLK